MEDAFSIVLIGMAAFLLPFAAGRVGLPAFVLEILFGIIAGPALLGLLRHTELVAGLAELGFLLLMFLSGFEIDFSRLERQGPTQLATGFAVFALTLGFAALAAFWLGFGPFVALLLATTSVGLVVPTLRSTGKSTTPLGQAILISALLADFLTLVGVAIYAIVLQHGVGWQLLGFPALVLSIVVVLVTLKRIAWWYPERVSRLFAAEDPEELGIRASLGLMFVFIGLSFLLGVEAILGAFLAGTVFAMVFRHRGQLERKLTGFAFGFFVPVFFIDVGMRFDVQAVLAPGVLREALALVAAAFAIKLFASLVLFFRGFGPREVLAAGMLLSARLSLVIAVAELGVRLGLIPDALESQAILLALVTSAICPAAFRLLVRGPSAPAPS